MIGSLLILGGIVFISIDVGSTNYFSVSQSLISPTRQCFLFLVFFLSFAVKAPIYPFHIWLPEAHVEAPTVGSVILAGVLLKLGTQGMLRFLLMFFPVACQFYQPMVYMLCTVGVIYSSLVAIRQTDIKRVIAYASVAHINVTLLGLFSLELVGLLGSIFQIIAHGLVSSALFICVGVLYDRGHSRLIHYYSGIALLMPLFSFQFFFFSIANISFPCTANFVGELLIMAGIFKVNMVAAFFSATSLVLGAVQSLWLLNRIIFGNQKTLYLSTQMDVSKEEFYALGSLLIATLFLGVQPLPFFDFILTSTLTIINGF